MSDTWGTITFGNANQTYVPGEQVTGAFTICIDPSVHSKISEIKLKYKGECSVDFYEYDGSGSNQRRKNFFAKEIYFRAEQLAYSKTSEVALEGECKYSFSFKLPVRLPSSFEGRYGHVRYTIKATITCGRFEAKKRIIAPFNVVSPLDLNNMEGARTPISVTCVKAIGLRKSGKLTGTITAPEKGYATGQAIPVQVTLDNATKKCVSHTKVYLKQKITYVGQVPSRKLKKQNRTMAEVKLNSMDPGETRTFNTTIMVPPLPPSILRHCTIIYLEYKLKADVYLGKSLTRALKISAAILIGTVPLVQQAHLNDNPPSYPASITCEGPPSYNEATENESLNTISKSDDIENTKLNNDART